jgi:MFS transporter, ACS family, DAL5 transporter family protein
MGVNMVSQRSILWNTPDFQRQPICKGGILSTWSFPTKDAPRFTKTTIMNLVLCVSASFDFGRCLAHSKVSVYSCVVMALGCLANSFILSRMNASKQRRRTEILAPYGDDDTDGKVRGGGLIAWKELGDKHPDFRYTI